MLRRVYWLNGAEDHAEQRGLANTCLTHDGGLSTLFEVVGEVRKDFPVANGIMEQHISRNWVHFEM